jgi:hypothetical protein
MHEMARFFLIWGAQAARLLAMAASPLRTLLLVSPNFCHCDNPRQIVAASRRNQQAGRLCSPEMKSPRSSLFRLLRLWNLVRDQKFLPDLQFVGIIDVIERQ